VLDYGGDGVP